MSTRDRKQSDVVEQTEADEESRVSLAGGDASTDSAIGQGGGQRRGASGESIGRSGRLSSEGTGPTPNPPSGGDPGGMGGPKARSRNADNRPPGGLSPAVDERKH